MKDILFNLFIILGGFVLIYLLLKKEIEKVILKKEEENFRFADIFKALNESFSFLRNEINLLKNEVYEHFKNTIEKQREIVETTSKLEEIARNLETGTNEIYSLKEILAGPKSRGYFGERILEEILSNLPNSFWEKQYPLGLERVDYVLKINETLIPVDAKFPLQNFGEGLNSKELIKNLKQKIESISKKYIYPYKGTVEFAILYLANEGLYYELLSNKEYNEVWQYARERSVFLTSPKNFELFCSSLLFVLRKQELGKNIDTVLNSLHQLEKDFLSLESKFETSFSQLQNSFKNLFEVSRILTKISNNFRNLIKVEKEIVKTKTLV